MKEVIYVNKICLPKSKYPRIVIIGGGFAGLEFVKGLKNTGYQLILIDRNNFHQFQPLLYQVATSGLEPDSIVFPFRKQIHGFKNVIYKNANVKEINTSNKTIITDIGSVDYDYLVIATGTATNFFGLQSIEEQSLGLKDIRDSINIRHQMLLNLEKATSCCNLEERKKLSSFVIVGGGSAGVEMAGALAEFRRYILPKDYPEYSSSLMKIYLIEGTDKILGTMSEESSSSALKYLKDLDIDILLNELVIDYKDNLIITKSGKKIISKNIIWTAGIKGQFPNGINTASIVPGNRLKTNGYLQVEGYEDIYSIGDVAALISEETPHGHPQIAQAAIQQGRYLAQNFKNKLSNKRSYFFKYKNKGFLSTIGRHRAVADIGRFKFAGYFAWLIWSFIHLISISGFKNKILVGINWLISYFSYEKSNRLIIVNKRIEV